MSNLLVTSDSNRVLIEIVSKPDGIVGNGRFLPHRGSLRRRSGRRLCHPHQSADELSGTEQTLLQIGLIVAFILLFT